MGGGLFCSLGVGGLVRLKVFLLRILQSSLRRWPQHRDLKGSYLGGVLGSSGRGTRSSKTDNRRRPVRTIYQRSDCEQPGLSSNWETVGDHVEHVLLD